MKDKRKTVLRLVLPAAAMFLVWSLYASRCQPEVTEYTVSSPRLPEAFDGYRIVQLSDLHAREFGEGNRDLVEQVRALAPDLIALTGDYIESEADIPITQSLVAQLTDIAPVYFSSGNHDWASGAAPELREAVEDAGGVWLSNESREVSRDGASILVAGVEDPNSYADMVRPDELLGRIDGDHPGSFILLLGHRNDWVTRYPDLPADVILCGHGHGGIIRLPAVGGLLGTDHRLFPEYDAGLFFSDRYVMVVSRGLGNNFWIPRLWNRPEIVCLTLRSE